MATTATIGPKKPKKKKRTKKEQAKLVLKFMGPPAVVLAVSIWPSPVVLFLNVIMRLCEATMLIGLAVFAGLGLSTLVRRVRDQLTGVTAPAPQVDLAMTVRPRPLAPSSRSFRRSALRQRGRGRPSAVKLA